MRQNMIGVSARKAEQNGADGHVAHDPALAEDSARDQAEAERLLFVAKS